MTKLLKFCLIMSSASLLAGCNTTKTAAKSDPANTVASNDDYEYVYPIGSSIAVKVPKKISTGLSAQDRIALEKAQNSVNSLVSPLKGFTPGPTK